MGRILFIAAICLGVAIVSPVAVRGTDDPDERIGDWGRVDRIVIEGAKAHNTETIRRATRHDIECIAASRPSAPLSNYPTVLASRIRAGYIADGFLDAQVSGAIDGAREAIVISIVEGPQYIRGEINVVGGEEVDVERLRQWITAEHPCSNAWLAGFDEADGRSEPQWVGPDGSSAEFDEAAWRVGSPACGGARTRIEKAVRLGLADQGYRFAKFAIDVAHEDGAQIVPLEIKINDPGPLALVDCIEVSGSDRDTADELREYLGIRPGDVYTNFVRARLWHKLWASGRYLHHSVEATESPEKERSIRLDIKLVDYAPVSRLMDPLEPVEQVLLKFREWISNAGARGDDLVLRVRGSRSECELISSETNGLLLYLRPIADKSDDDSTPKDLRDVAFLATPGEMLLLHDPWKRKYQAALKDHQFTLQFSLRPRPSPQPEGEQFEMKVWVGFKHVDLDEDENPFRLAIDLSPAAILSLAHRKGNDCTVGGGVLSIAKQDGRGRIRIDVETGRLIEWSSSEAIGDGTQFSLAVDHGMFSRRKANIDEQLPQALPDLPNDFDPNQPLGTLATTVLGSPLPAHLLHLLALDDEQLALANSVTQSLAKMCAAGLLKPIDDLGLFSVDDAIVADTGFKIPVSPNTVRAGLQHSAIGEYAYMIAKYCDDVFPHDSWAWIVCRNLVLAEFGQGGLSEDLSFQDVGPLGLLCLAYWPNLPASTIVTVTERALNLASATDFAKDYRSLLKRGSLAGDVVFQLAETLRGLSDEEITPLDTLLFGTGREVLVSAARTLRERREEELQDVLPTVLDQVWVDGLREHFQFMLRDLYVNNVLLARQSNGDNSRKQSTAKSDELPEDPSLVPRSPDRVFGKPNWNGN